MNKIISKFRKCHRYLVYRIYHLSDEDPQINVIVILSVVHACQIFTCMFLLYALFSFNVFVFDKSEVALFMLCFMAFHGYLFKGTKWESYDLEFGHETKSEKQKRSILAYGYLIVSVLLPIILPVLFKRLFH